MMLGARTAAWAKSGYTAKDYVQDGLIAMWDGIENAGWGVHDPNATTWKDLVGGVEASNTHYGIYEWKPNALVLPGIAGHSLRFTLQNLTDAVNQNNASVECVFKPEHGTATGNNAIFGFGINQRILWIWGAAVTTIRGSDKTQSQDFITDGVVNVITYSGGNIYKNGFLHGVASIGTETATENRGQIGQISGYYSAVGNYTSLCGDAHSIRIYNRNITQTEIAANYAIDKARFNLQ